MKKKILIIIIIVVLIVSFGLMLFNKKSNNGESSKINVIATNFAVYDFLRAIIGDNENINLAMLIGPGKDAHSYDPTIKDLIKIQDADLFVYIGGEMENWSDKVLESILPEKNEYQEVVCISDYVDKIKEEQIDGVEELTEGSFDDHIWTSPANAIKMVEILEKYMEKIDEENASTYLANSEKYINEIINVDNQIKEIVANKKRNRLVFADKMPMQYFIDYYGLEVTAAFSGCSTETEPSPSTIAYLEDKVKEDNIPVILYIELNNGNVAKTIADEIGSNCSVMQIQTLHNVSYNDFKNGETWVSLMTKNIDVLKKALQ